MPSYRVTYFFESVQSSAIGAGSALGWTESFYRTDPALSLEQAITDDDHQRYLRYRAAFMSSIYYCNFIRVSDEGNPRRFKVASIPVYPGNVLVGKSQAAQVQCAILADLQKLPAVDQPTERVHHRRFLIRGLPSSLILGNVLNPLSPQWMEVIRFLQFIADHQVLGDAHPAGLEKYKWGAKYLSPTARRARISDVALDNPRHIRFLTLPSFAPFAIGSKWAATGFVDFRQYNRVWTVTNNTVVGPDTWGNFGTARRDLPTPPATIVGNPHLQEQVFNYGPFDQFAIVGLRNKRTGRVFRQLRGRSSGR